MARHKRQGIRKTGFRRSGVGFGLSFIVEFNIELMFFKDFTEGSLFFTCHCDTNTQITENRFHLRTIGDLSLHRLDLRNCPAGAEPKELNHKKEDADQDRQRPENNSLHKLLLGLPWLQVNWSLPVWSKYCGYL